MMKTFNGHRSWNAWNVSLWINNDENTYKFCQEVIDDKGFDAGVIYLAEALRGQKTPDGAIYNKTSIKEALK